MSETPVAQEITSDPSLTESGKQRSTTATLNAYFEATQHTFKRGVNEVHHTSKAVVKEIRTECFEIFDIYESLDFVKRNWTNAFFVPYFPAFHKPGWLLRYAVGPYDFDWFMFFLNDFWAGLTVALTLIPQALSYATLANLPAIHGLYTAILPAATYTFFGSSMQLCVGPVALVSLMTAELINSYDIDYTNNPEEAVAFASEAAIAVGVILTAMSLLNLGNLIRLISHPVMSGFTTAAAMIIGLNQLKAAFGFTLTVPQAGQEGYDYNYQVMQWFIDHWYDHYHFTAAEIQKKKSLAAQNGRSVRNPYAAKICFGLFIPLIIIQIIKAQIKATPERKKTWAFNIWYICSSLSPFIGIIIGGHVAYEIKKSDNFNDPSVPHEWYKKKLSIVGKVASGLDFIKTPHFQWDFGQLLADVFPTALIAFMESYSVANRMATIRNELHILNPSQELWAIGIGNFLAGVSSSYPVAGSFSRSSLNCSTGARTPLSKAINMIIVILALQYLTKTFQYIPNAALAAVIWVAIFNLVSFGDFWHAWKHSKKDFFVMLATAVIVFVFDTSVGLAVGIGASFLVFILDTIFNPENAPDLLQFDEAHRNGDVTHIILKGDLNFLTIGKLIDKVTSVTLLKHPEDPVFETWNERVFYQVSSTFDKYLKPRLIEGVEKLPKVLVIDFSFVRVTDLTSLISLLDIISNLRDKKIKVAILNATPYIAESFLKHEFKNDEFDDVLHSSLLEVYHQQSGDIIPKNNKSEKTLALADIVQQKEDDEEEQGLVESHHGYQTVQTNEYQIQALEIDHSSNV